MPETETSLLNLVNASGFLFQLRVEQEIKATQPYRRGNWEIAAREHRWFDPQEGAEGFIDLVLISGVGRMVIECKRVTDGHWVFLIPDKRDRVSRARTLWTMRSRTNEVVANWHDFSVMPPSPETAFCIVRGQGEKDTPMLERLASLVLRSVESLANEELNYSARSEGNPCIYFPVIITNASLHVCRFDPATIDISTGQITNANFQQVPYIRFRKNFSSKLLSRQEYRDIEKVNQDNERTVFVVNSVDLANTLRDWNIPYNESNAPWPWENLR